MCVRVFDGGWNRGGVSGMRYGRDLLLDSNVTSNFHVEISNSENMINIYYPAQRVIKIIILETRIPLLLNVAQKAGVGWGCGTRDYRFPIRH